MITADRLASPRLYPIAFDPAAELTRLVALEEAQYRAASFLDERILPDAGAETPASWPELSQAAPPGGACDFIFHTGHVGSTLLSRLLGLSDRVFSLREPAVLRTLALTELAGGAGDRLETWSRTFLALWGRAWRPEQRVLLKATSFASEMGPLLMQLVPSASAILLLVSPSVYLAGIFAGEESLKEARTVAPLRLARLHRRLGRPAWRLDDLAPGELVAMGWLSEVASLADIAAALPGRVLWLDFELFLARPDAGLAAALRRLHGEAREPEIAAMLSSAEMGRYSKAPEFAYDAGLRRRVLTQANADHAAEIDRGVAWLNATGGAFPALADAMRSAAAGMRAIG